MLRTLAKAHDALTHWSLVAATVLLGAIFLTYCLEVVLRYLLNSPTSWSGEFISYGQCASVFLVMPMLTKVGGHVAITTVCVERGQLIGVARVTVLADRRFLKRSQIWPGR